MAGGASTRAALRAARALAVDGATIEVVRELRRAGIEPILLKGPALAALLWPGEPRPYSDADLLVADAAAASDVLRGLGFVRMPVAVEPELGLPHAHPWARADGAQVDLHVTLAGAGAAPADVWAALEPRARVERVARCDVRVPDAVATALIAAMHAAQHRDGRPLEDLRRALAALDLETWREAAALAERIDATISFTTGLRLLPDGAALAERFGMPDAALVDAARGAGSSTRLALGFERLASARGVRAKAALLARELAPPPDHMRWWSPLARRGHAGLAAAYLLRVAALLRDAPAGARAWWRLRGAKPAKHVEAVGTWRGPSR
jgi:putative nucleotidyltransferase-like protein